MRPLVPGKEITDLLEPYRNVDRSATDRWVMANMVAGLDGCVAVDGRVGPLSEGPDLALFRMMRSLADIVLVGAGTARAESYGPVRLPSETADGTTSAVPIAVVSKSLDLDWTSELFATGQGTKVITCASADPERIRRAERHAEVIVAGDENVDVGRALSELAAGVVLCEGGPLLLGHLVSEDLLDELCLTLSPKMGADPLPVSVASDRHELRNFALRHVAAADDTLFLRYERSRATEG